jgi:hypothetical protein
MSDFDTKDEVFLITVVSTDDPENEYVTFVKGTNELAYFLLHYNKDLYEFTGAETFCPGSKMYWDFKELLNVNGKGEKK